MAACGGCLGRTPFGTLLAAVMVIAGTSVFCGSTFRALQLIIDDVFHNLFGFNIGWLEILQKMFIVICAIMAVFALVLLVFGFLATGATRSNIYSGAKCIMGGRLTAAVFLTVSYILTLGWLAVLAICMVSLVGYAAVGSICNQEVNVRSSQELERTSYCFNLTRFGFYSLETGSDHLCDSSQLRTLCNKVSEAGPLFCVAFGGSALTILGMINFLAALASNYTRIKVSKELTAYRDAMETSEAELYTVEKQVSASYVATSTTV